ncbi:MAG: FGGY-family carbohydrate kinase [Clostridiales bacterium]|nr:FGGY-family carbohydrate kinase [Clostridiales bacterium]
MDCDAKQAIIDGKAILGIELGSTRIKAVLIGQDFSPIASGAHEWENRLENGIWTYHLEDVWHGLQDSFNKLSMEAKSKYGVGVTSLKAIGISGMMHGYLAFGKDGTLLAPFRTWRNTTTEKAARLLSEEFQFNVPLRWNISHLYQAILNNESHVSEIEYLTTLAGYVHWKLTGQKVIGVGDASGIFPIDSGINSYHPRMVEQFNSLIAKSACRWKLEDILPKVLSAGDSAGALTEEGAKLLDPTGALKPCIPLCPPEGDAGTGMAATNSVASRTGNVSAGTSLFAMIVLEKELKKVYPEIDMVTTPSGKPVAMVHCNNCTTALDAWVKLFGEAASLFGAKPSKSDLYEALYLKALEGEADCGGLLSYNYYSGEPITGFDAGKPLFAQLADSRLNIANFMRTHLFSALATLKIGMDILTDNEHVRLDQLLGHGGFFKTKGVGQRFMACALNVPVTVMESAAEGGAWGIALLAAYMSQKGEGETLEDFLSRKVFGDDAGSQVAPDEKDLAGFSAFMERYKKGFAIERAAVENLC